MIELLSVPNEAYHADTSRISKSGLDQIARSPLHYWQKYLAPDREPDTKTPALLLGSAIHSAILEPASFESDYLLAPKFNRRSNAGKEEAAAWEAANAGKQIISPEDYDCVQRMREAVLRNGPAAQLLAKGQAEGTLHFTEPETGVLCKARLDWFRPDSGGIIVDVKSTEDASPAGFAKSIANYRYHVQAAYYTDAFAFAGYTPPKRFVFLAVEKKAPYATALYVLDSEAMEVGRELYSENLKAYALATHTNEWKCYSTGIETLKLPVWALNKI